jgi:hypothetical protein
MSEFYTSVFRDGEKADRRTIRDVGRALLPATASGSSVRSSAPPTPYPSAQHADGENIQAALYDIDPYDDEHYIYG